MTTAGAGERDESARRVGSALRTGAALNRVLRWASRTDVRRELVGPAGADLSPTDTWLLTAIHERGPVRASELASWQGVDRSTMTTQVRRLEDRGLVARTPHPTDRRAVLLELTPRGAQVHRRIALAGAALVDRVLAGWEATDREGLADVLVRLADALDDPRRG